MAPLRGAASRTTSQPKSILKTASSTSATSNSDLLFTASKKDKRRIKHAQLINKVTKSATQKKRRRRPNKKLITTLDSLADALPDDGDDNANGNSAAGTRPEDQVNIIRRKSMKSRPGAMKRREKLDNSERDRFAKNMAQLATPKPVAAQSGADKAVPSMSERFAALRGFISQTMETKPELKNLKT